MAATVPAVGEDLLLKFALGVLTPGNQTLKLYVNDYTPVDSSTAGSFTEMSTHGYAAKTLTKTSWLVTQVSAIALGSYAQQTWTFTAAPAVTVYGYYVIDATTGTLLWAERFGTAVVISSASDTISITPQASLRQYENLL